MAGEVIAVIGGVLGTALVSVAAAGVRELRGVVLKLASLDATVGSLDERIGRIEDRVFKD